MNPASGNIAVDGQTLEVDSGVTLAAFVGNLTIAATASNLDRVVIDGTVSDVLTVSSSQRALTTEGIAPVTFQANIGSSFSDAYNLTIEAPPDWSVNVDPNCT